MNGRNCGMWRRPFLAAVVGLAVVAVGWTAAQDVRERATLALPNTPCLAVAFSHDGKIVATGAGTAMPGGQQGEKAPKIGPAEVRLWDATTGKQVGSPLQGHKTAVTSVAFSRDGKLIATGGEDKTVKIWTIENMEKITEKATLEGHTGSVLTVAFSPDCKLLATGSYDRTVRLWDVDSGKQIGEPLKSSDSVWAVVFRPDGKVLAGSTWGEVRLWEANGGKECGLIKGHGDWIFGLSFSPDGKKLASGGSDKMVRLWDVDSAKEEKVLKGHTLTVYGVAYSPDGQLLASGAGEYAKAGELKVWDPATGEEKKGVTAHKERISAVAFSPDGRTIATSSFDKTAKLWDTGK